MNFYDLIYCQDYYQVDITQDDRRSKVAEIQKDVDLETRKQYEKINYKLQNIPGGLSLD